MNAFTVAGVTVAGRTLRRDGMKATLGERDERILALLLLSVGVAVTYAQLSEAVFGEQRDRRAVQRVVRRIWHRLDNLGVRGRELIVELPDVGYCIPGDGPGRDPAELRHMGALTLDRATGIVSWEDRCWWRLSPTEVPAMTALIEGAGRTVVYATFADAARRDGVTYRPGCCAALGRILAGLMYRAAPAKEIVVTVFRLGFRLQLPDDPQVLRCWGIELDRLRRRLVVEGRERTLVPELEPALALLVAAAGVPVGDDELQAVGDLGLLMREYGWLVEALPERRAHRLAPERVTPGLEQVGALSLHLPTGRARSGDSEADLSQAGVAVLTAVMRSPVRRIGRAEMQGAVWPPSPGNDRTLDTTVREVASALPSRTSAPPLVATIGRDIVLRVDHDPRPLPQAAGGIEVDPDNRETRLHGIQMSLNEREFSLLHALVRAPAYRHDRRWLLAQLGFLTRHEDAVVTRLAAAVARALADAAGDPEAATLVVVLPGDGVGLAIEAAGAPVIAAGDLRLFPELRTLACRERRSRPLTDRETALVAVVLGEPGVRFKPAELISRMPGTIDRAALKTTADRVRDVLRDLGAQETLSGDRRRGYALKSIAGS